jgi:hypothetical protein
MKYFANVPAKRRRNEDADGEEKTSSEPDNIDFENSNFSFVCFQFVICNSWKLSNNKYEKGCEFAKCDAVRC